MELLRRIKVAQGTMQADVVFKNARYVNVFTKEILQGDVAIVDGWIAGIGEYHGRLEIDVSGKIIVPGFIDAHVHVESSMVSPAAFAASIAARGTAAAIADPHEITNVLGAQGVRFVLEHTQEAAADVYVMLPSCVPATPFEHNGASFDAEDMRPFLGHPRVIGLGEMMNYPGVLSCDEKVLHILELFEGRQIDGHAPGLAGLPLQAYCAAGITTDHECINYAEVKEKLRAGMYVQVREGSSARELEHIIRGVVDDGMDTSRLLFCTDDKHINDLVGEGHIDHCVRKAIACGMDPIDAICAATIQPAQCYGLRHYGAIAPGYKAHLIVLDDLKHVVIDAVYHLGKPVTQDTALPVVPPSVLNTIHIADIQASDMALQNHESVIALTPGSLYTRHEHWPEEKVAEGLRTGELCKTIVLERHFARKCIGVGVLKDFVRVGAIATSVAHDSHNIIAAGANDGDLLLAIQEIERMQGGYVVVRDGRVLASLPLRIAGLMSCEPVEDVIQSLKTLHDCAISLGIPPEMEPFVTLSFLALPVIPEIRITDQGLFDVTQFKFIRGKQDSPKDEPLGQIS